MKETLLERLGVLYLDHIAVTTTDLEATSRNYLAMPGARLLRGPGINETQRVHYCFVQVGDTTFEILAPIADSDSPILNHLQNGGGPYHVCYAVADMDHSRTLLNQHRAKILLEPVADIAFDGRRVMFAYSQELGVFELVEAIPSEFIPLNKETPLTIERAPSTSHHDAKYPIDSTRVRVSEVFTSVFPHLDDNEVENLDMTSSPGWDSLSQLRLIMELEQALGEKISSSDIYKLTSFRAIVDYFENRHG
ncbi:MAG: VOC family protein [Gammaproteobacteria bacterium]|nr:VOC family protein [Gammaproteobacteria bacterium]